MTAGEVFSATGVRVAKRSHLLLPLLVLISLVAGCAASPSAEEGQAPRRQPNRLSVEEIQQAQAQNAFDLIRSLRPQWLQSRGAQSIASPTAGQVVIYLDGTRAGGAEILRQIPAGDLQGAQYLSASEASARFGTDHTGGAILITTRRR